MSRLKTIFLLTAIYIAVWNPVVEASQEDVTAFEDDWVERAAEVNEGELRILKQRTGLREHHHHNHLTLSTASLETGWVDLYQCHTNLDVTPALQIVFVQDRTRDLHIVSQSKIGKAWVKLNTVQLEDISPGSRICISLKTRALSINDKIVLLKNGPFMRRFLDGYYPMRISMQVEYPPNKIRFVDMKPKQVARRVDHINGLLELEARFEGRLNTEIRFEQRKFEDQ